MDQPKCTFLNYSFKNLPIPTVNEYRKRLIEKVESFVRRMRWRTFFFLQGSDRTEEPTLEETYTFNSVKCPPQVEELKPFKEDLIQLNENIQFRHVHGVLQSKLREECAENQRFDTSFRKCRQDLKPV